LIHETGGFPLDGTAVISPADSGGCQLYAGASDTTFAPFFQMRILWITPGFAADESDVNCIPPLQLLAKTLTGRGIDLEIIAVEYPFKTIPYLWNNIPVISGYGFNKNRFKWLNWNRVIRHARQRHRNKPFDLIHSFWLGPAWLIGNYLASGWNIRHITTLMGQDVLPGNRYRLLLRRHHAPNLIALSPFQNQVFQQTTGLSARRIIPWGVDPAEIPQTLESERPLDLLGCGSLIPVKNWELWLEVVAGLIQSKPGLRAELIGDGPQRHALEKRIHSLNLAKNVVLTGALPRPQVLEKMRSAQVLLHTARFESFGFVFAEAAMSGCRIVSTPVGAAAAYGECGQDAGALQKLVLESRIIRPATPYLIADCADAYVEGGITD
jgi:glycosyltransferase involved in cell wall biosynthesis